MRFTASIGTHHVAKGRLEADDPDALLEQIELLADDQAFYSLNIWERSQETQARVDAERQTAIANGEKPRADGKRLAQDWVGASGVQLDLDRPGHAAMTGEDREMVDDLIARGGLPITAGHATFGGLHGLVLYGDGPVRDGVVQARVAAYVAALVLSAYEAARSDDPRLPRLVLDPLPFGPSGLLYAPCARDPKGRERRFRFRSARPILTFQIADLDASSRPTPSSASTRADAGASAVHVRATGATPFGLEVLRSACGAVEAAPEGQRHLRLLRHARLVAGYVAGGEIEEQLARDCLESAGLTRGLSARETEEAIQWAFTNGKELPLARPVGRYRGGRRS